LHYNHVTFLYAQQYCLYSLECKIVYSLYNYTVCVTMFVWFILGRRKSVCFCQRLYNNSAYRRGHWCYIPHH